MTRRTLLKSTVTAPFLGATAAKSSSTPFRYADIEARIARRDFRAIHKEDLGTPSMIVDKALLEANLQKMAGHCRTTGIHLRAHCKIHKSTDIARRQVALGSLGISCATIAECELMAGAGIRNVLHTCQPAGKNKIWRAVDLAARDATFMVVADDPLTVDLLDEAAAARRVKLIVLVDIYSGLTRHGHAAGEPGLALAQRVAAKKHLVFGGIMGYSGNASHTKGFEARQRQSLTDVGPVVETASLCRKAGLDVAVVSGGSTGTYNIDKEIGLTELQAGSYIFMDTAYMKIGGIGDPERYADFQPALTVMTTVISRNHPRQAAIDAGNKAMLRTTDQVKGRGDIVIENQGAEYGILKWNDGDELKLGQRVEIYCSNLDTSTNVYDRYYVCEGDRVVDVWPIMGRAGAVQR